MDPLETPLGRFLLGEGPHGAGYTLPQILAWDDDAWEHEHDFIQWLFPTDRPSAFNADAPTASPADAAALGRSPAVRRNLRDAYARWLRFCGLAEAADGSVSVERPRPAVWGRPNHNWLRVTRVLTSLRLFGLHAEAAGFYAFLRTRRAAVGEATFRHWEAAMNRLSIASHGGREGGEGG